ncbi:recombination protein RecR [Acetobacteraceae bacterium]|nr:recombination protein RecR [Candidatus Parcubacteria bacterium]
MNPIDRLTMAFERFPGIGPRQARRFVQYLLQSQAGYRTALAEDIKKLGLNTFQCLECFRWSVKQGETNGICSICGSAQRDKGILFVVEKDADIETVERSGFKGLYFVLGSTIPLGSEEPEEKYTRAKELLARAQEEGTQKKLKEIILGLSATTEGDHTRLILSEKLRPLSETFDFKLSSLGRGLSTGSELEYADPDTIQNALNSRG